LDDEVAGQGYLCMNFPMHELETRTNLNGEQRVVITWDIRSGTLDHLEQVVKSAQEALRRALLERYAAQN